MKQSIMPFHSLVNRSAGVVRLCVLAGLLALLAGCSSTGDGPPDYAEDVSGIPDAVPKVEPRAKYGNMKSYVVFGKRYYTKKSSGGHVERGLASWYGKKFHGRKTSSGERYDMYAMTAAHKTLPLPTYARVTNLKNGRSAVVKINDRGPFHGPRIIDLSYSAARKLGVVRAGTAMVEVRTIDPRRPDSGGDGGLFLADAKTLATRKASGAKKSAAAEQRNVASTQPREQNLFLADASTPATGRASVADESSNTGGTSAASVRTRSQNLFLADATEPAPAEAPAAAKRVVAKEPVVAEKRAPIRETNSALAQSKPQPVEKPRNAAPKRIPAQLAKTETAPPPEPVEPKVAAKTEPKAVPKEEPKIASAPAKSAPAASSGSGLYLQVGAFGNRNNAEQLQRQLVEHFADKVQVRTSDGSSSRLYKVRVGPLASRQKADNVSQKLAGLGVTQSHVVVE